MVDINNTEIFFTNRIAKGSGGKLLIGIPADETAFEHRDLVKITLIRKADKSTSEEDSNEGEENLSEQSEQKK